jgi:hypothetical protein
LYLQLRQLLLLIDADVAVALLLRHTDASVLLFPTLLLMQLRRMLMLMQLLEQALLLSLMQLLSLMLMQLLSLLDVRWVNAVSINGGLFTRTIRSKY